MKLIVFWKDKDASSKKYSFIEYAYDSYFGNFLKRLRVCPVVRLLDL